MSFADEVDLAFHEIDAGDRRLASLWSRPTGRASRGLVVLPSSLMKRMFHYATLSRLLVRAGWSTLRFDLANNSGASPGDIEDASLSSIAEDLGAACAAARALEERRALVATSFVSLPAVRVAGARDPVDSLVLVVPAVDARDTVTRAVGRDLVGEWRAGARTDRDEVFLVEDFPIRMAFIGDLVAWDYDDTERLREDVRKLPLPVTAVASRDDEWVAFEDVERALSGEADHARRLLMFEGSSHKLGRNPPAMRLLGDVVLDALSRDLGAEAVGAAEHLDFQDMIETVSLERDWERSGYRPLRR